MFVPYFNEINFRGDLFLRDQFSCGYIFIDVNFAIFRDIFYFLFFLLLANLYLRKLSCKANKTIIEFAAINLGCVIQVNISVRSKLINKVHDVLNFMPPKICFTTKRLV